MEERISGIIDGLFHLSGKDEGGSLGRLKKGGKMLGRSACMRGCRA